MGDHCLHLIVLRYRSKWPSLMYELLLQLFDPVGFLRSQVITGFLFISFIINIRRLTFIPPFRPFYDIRRVLAGSNPSLLPPLSRQCGGDSMHGKRRCASVFRTDPIYKPPAMPGGHDFLRFTYTWDLCNCCFRQTQLLLAPYPRSFYLPF